MANRIIILLQSDGRKLIDQGFFDCGKRGAAETVWYYVVPYNNTTSVGMKDFYFNNKILNFISSIGEYFLITVQG